jgi:hypothetical protein
MHLKDMDFIVIAIIILLGLGAWFFIVQKDKLNLLDGKSLRDFLTSRPELPKKVEEPIATTIVSPTEFRPATTIPVQLPPVFTEPEQPKIVNTPVVPLPAMEVKTLKASYASVADLAKDCQDYVYAVILDGKSVHTGFGPADSFITKADGTIVAGILPVAIEQELTVEEEKG